jgi:hypothetical protein
MITEEQQRSFQENGYIILKQQLSQAWIDALRATAEWWMQLGILLDRDNIPLADHGMLRSEKGAYIYSVIDLHHKGRVESLELLGSPPVLEPATQLCGSTLVPVIETLEVRRPEDTLDVRWNQRRLHQPTESSIVIVVALDTILEQHGAQHLAPGTHHAKQDMCEIQRRYGFEPEGLVVASLQAGDILICDTMLATCSPKLENGPIARTIEFEFCNEGHALNRGGQTPEWVSKKRAMLPYAKALYSKFHEGIPDEQSFASNEDRAKIFKEDFVRISSFYALKTLVEPSHFCVEFKPGDRIGNPRRMSELFG